MRERVENSLMYRCFVGLVGQHSHHGVHVHGHGHGYDRDYRYCLRYRLSSSSQLELRDVAENSSQLYGRWHFGSTLENQILRRDLQAATSLDAFLI
jgi:hypothetical protein